MNTFQSLLSTEISLIAGLLKHLIRKHQCQTGAVKGNTENASTSATQAMISFSTGCAPVTLREMMPCVRLHCKIAAHVYKICLSKIPVTGDCHDF